MSITSVVCVSTYDVMKGPVESVGVFFTAYDRALNEGKKSQEILYTHIGYEL